MHFFDSSESVTQKSHHLDPIYMKSPFKFFKLMTGLLLPYFSLPKTDYSLDVLWQIFSIATLFKRIPMPLMIYPFNWGKYPGINILQINIAKISRSVLVSPAIWTFENWSEKKSFTNLCAYNNSTPGVSMYLLFQLLVLLDFIHGVFDAGTKKHLQLPVSPTPPLEVCFGKCFSKRADLHVVNP